MLKKKYYLIGSVAVVVLVSMFFVNSDKTKASVKSDPKTPVTHYEDSVKTIAAAPRKDIHRITSGELKQMHNALPDIEQVKEEINSHPHGTPPSLLKFARTMRPLMEKGLKNKADAQKLLNALGECALNETSAQAARVLCVTNSERLSEMHPELKAKAKDLRATVDPEIKKILERQDALKK